MTQDWRIGGLMLGLVFFLAIALVKPIGVSTQFVIFDGILWRAVDNELIQTTEKGMTSTNAYLAKSGGKYAKSVENPINYSFIFVLAMMLGGALSVGMRGGLSREEKELPEMWRNRFGNTPWKRYITAFIGGFIVLYGARLAGGCTSGHMMSGMMQTAVSGYIFAAGAFMAAIPTALWIYGRRI